MHRTTSAHDRNTVTGLVKWMYVQCTCIRPTNRAYARMNVRTYVNVYERNLRRPTYLHMHEYMNACRPVHLLICA